MFQTFRSVEFRTDGRLTLTGARVAGLDKKVRQALSVYFLTHGNDFNALRSMPVDCLGSL